MRITFILFSFFNVLLASPLPGHDSLPLRRRLHDIANADVLPHNPVTLPPQKFEGCTGDQEKGITEAVRHAVAYVNDSLDYLKTYRGFAPRFKEWFGHPNPARWEMLQTLFQDMDEHIPHNGVYICDLCKEDEYTNANAYVKPEDLGRVHICPGFSKRPLVGHQSKAGIIVHEWSHFNAIGVTYDHDKTRRASRRLAEWNPDLALENAYSIQYFAENDPPLA